MYGSILHCGTFFLLPVLLASARCWRRVRFGRSCGLDWPASTTCRDPVFVVPPPAKGVERSNTHEKDGGGGGNKRGHISITCIYLHDKNAVSSLATLSDKNTAVIAIVTLLSEIQEGEDMVMVASFLLFVVIFLSCLVLSWLVLEQAKKTKYNPRPRSDDDQTEF